MKRVTWILMLMALAGCFTRPAMMNKESFGEISLGTPISDVCARVGSPYQIRCLGGGREEYEYLEKIDMGSSVVMQNHYYLVVLEGQVVCKRYCQERPPAFDFIYKDDPTLSY